MAPARRGGRRAAGAGAGAGAGGGKAAGGGEVAPGAWVRLRAGGSKAHKGKARKGEETYYLGRAEAVGPGGDWVDVRWLYLPGELVARVLPPELRPGARGGAGPLPRERLLTDHVDRQPVEAIEGLTEVVPASELAGALGGEDGPFFWRHVWVGGRVRADPDGALGAALLRGEISDIISDAADTGRAKRKAAGSPAPGGEFSPSELPPARKKRKGPGGLAAREVEGPGVDGQEILERAEKEQWLSADDTSRLRELANRSHPALDAARMSLSPRVVSSPAAAASAGREEGTTLLRDVLKTAATEAWESLTSRQDQAARFAGEVIVEAAHGDAFLVSLGIHGANYRGWLTRVAPRRRRPAK